MNNYPFVSYVKRGLVNGAKCLITGREFASTDAKLFDRHWDDACAHAREVVEAQDTIDGEYRPRNLLLLDRQNLWKASNE